MKTMDEKLSYIAAFIDGEGHIGNHLSARGNYIRSISFCNTDKSLIDVMVRLLSECGFTPRVTYDQPQRSGWSARWTVYIGGGKSAFELFYKRVPIQSASKKLSLKNLLGSYVPKDVTRAKKRNGVESKCETCGISVYVSKANRQRGCGRFCSYDCSSSARKRRVTRKCEGCEILYETTVSYGKKSKFCSLHCFGKTNAPKMAAMSKMAAESRWRKKSLST